MSGQPLRLRERGIEGAGIISRESTASCKSWPSVSNCSPVQSQSGNCTAHSSGLTRESVPSVLTLLRTPRSSASNKLLHLSDLFVATHHDCRWLSMGWNGLRTGNCESMCKTRKSRMAQEQGALFRGGYSQPTMRITTPTASALHGRASRSICYGQAGNALSYHATVHRDSQPVREGSAVACSGALLSGLTGFCWCVAGS